jgi:hypothetical protein
MSDTATPPPRGDIEQAEKYLRKLINLLNADLVELTHTDLSQFDPSSLQDHYRVDLDDYQVEISHSKQANTGEDSFVMLFTNIKKIQADFDQKIILAYTYIDMEQFKKFKMVADDYMNRKKAEQDKKRFEQAMEPVNEALDKFSHESMSSSQSNGSNLSNSQPSHNLGGMKPLSQYSNSSSTESSPPSTDQT